MVYNSLIYCFSISILLLLNHINVCYSGFGAGGFGAAAAGGGRSIFSGSGAIRPKPEDGPPEAIIKGVLFGSVGLIILIFAAVQGHKIVKNLS